MNKPLFQAAHCMCDSLDEVGDLPHGPTIAHSECQQRLVSALDRDALRRRPLRQLRPRSVSGGDIMAGAPK
ncbi:hypothetical protein ACIOC1_04265 [Streptomyces sp. NPDC088197]|uniref:hypothetical protein n=1 Tax=Streptomyces sp. NPDC088197 TaxID=3365840 RepID=UPI00382EFE30